MHISVRKAVIDDAPQIAAVHVATWRAIYQGLIDKAHLDSLDVGERRQKWESLLEKTGPDYMVLVVEDEKGVVGFAHIGVSDDAAKSNEAELYSIYLNPEYHGQGYGSALFKACQQEIKQMGRQKFFCWVIKAHIQGHQFYKRMGGRLISNSEKRLVIGDTSHAIVSYEWIF